MPQPAHRSLALLALTLLALLGVADGVYLTLVHIDYETGRDGLQSACHALTEAGCSVTAGRFGSIRSVPVSLLGFAGSFALFVLGAAAWVRRRHVHDPLRAVVLVLGALTVVASIVMAALSLLEGSFCPFCVVWYGINIGIFASAYVARDRGNHWQDHLDEALGRSGFLAMGLFAAALLAGLWAYHGRREALIAEFEKEMFSHADEIARAEWARAQQQPPLKLPVGGTPTQGPADAKVEVVEFSDFQCPFCKKLWDSIEESLQTSKVPFRLHFVHYPLNKACNGGAASVPDDMHPQACEAAIAAECAHQQNKFWEYGSLLFAHQDALARVDLVAYAEQLGLEVDRFKTCLDDPKTQAFIVANTRLGELASVTGTPTMFVNGYRFVGGMPSPILNALLKVAAEDTNAPAEPPTSAPTTPEPASPTTPATPEPVPSDTAKPAVVDPSKTDEATPPANAGATAMKDEQPASANPPSSPATAQPANGALPPAAK